MTTTDARPWFGVHAGLQRTTTAELIDLWGRIEEVGYDWISIWDHFYAADGSGDPHCLEATACHAALATVTDRVRCGSLVYSAGYRHPAVLANAIATIDQLCDGRATLGVGGGWLRGEYDAYGIPYGTPGERLRRLRESLTCIRSLLRDDVTNFEGEFFTMTEARCVPKPVQAELPLWVGGGGEQVTLRIAAELADGWNIPFVGPDTWAHKSAVLTQHCEDVGRDPSAVVRTVNLGLARDDDDLRAQFAEISELVRPGVLNGSGQQLVDRIGEYVEAGAEGVILALRSPFDVEAMEAFAAEVVPAFR